MADKDKIEKDYQDMKSGKFSFKIKNKADGYVKGAVTGGALGIIVGLILKKRFLIWTIGGAIGGGYVGYLIAESKESQPNFISGN
jgi:uncharacterized protein YcfJ